MGNGKGRRRPVDWQPLAEKDPVPGDPEDIRAEVTKMKDLAKTLRDQARILRKVDDGDALKGNYADKIREKSGELEKHFRETAGRYERVVGDLGKWANELEGFQERADGILKAAKRADEHHAAEVKKKEAEAKKDDDKKAPEDSDSDSHLASYRKQLNEVISERDTRAQHFANNIGDDISDVIKDSTWENFAQGLDTALEVIGYLGLALAVVAIFCTPVGWVAALATALTWVSLAGHVLLAVTGEGSWTDVAFDALALATMGLGTAAMKGLKAGRALTKTASKAAASTQKARQQFDRYKNMRKLLDKNITRYGANSERGQKALRAKQRLREKFAGEMRTAKQAEADAPMAQAGRGLGEKEGREMAEDVKRMQKDFAGDKVDHAAKEVRDSAKAVDAGAKEALSAHAKFQLYWGVGTGVDAVDKGIDNTSSLFGYDGYEKLKDVPTIEVGSGW
ncbi:putative T7SS-secreted protein [Streptomyces sp. NPDC059850]|uniref:putative T7SS-secreted protein n=1 Tax=Streptomyces sp. NPDC059850 TaxID=3346970 RepID=UPI00365EC9F9